MSSLCSEVEWKFFSLIFGFNLPNFTTLGGCPLKNLTFMQNLVSYYICITINGQHFYVEYIYVILQEVLYILTVEKKVTFCFLKYPIEDCLAIVYFLCLFQCFAANQNKGGQIIN